MPIVREVRDPTEARRLIAQGLWLARLVAPTPEAASTALRHLRELAAGGEPVPPIGFVADVAQIALGGPGPLADRARPEVPGWPPGLARTYEDQVLGKLDADGSMARAADALARSRGRDRDRGLGFLIEALRRRAGFGGLLLNPAVVKAALELPPDALRAEGWRSLAADGPAPQLRELYDELIAAVREAPEALGPEDLFELEHGTALAAFGQRVALRQVLQAAAEFEASAAVERPRPAARRHDVATRLLDEDTYPVGGFSSIANRGSIESLLHSQLAYMEPGERPDLFDIKYARDELLYYARDENQFFRRRRAYLVALFPDLALARVRDPELPRQRLVLGLALLLAATRRVADWLSDEALRFEFLFVRGPDGESLEPERELVEMLLAEAIAGGWASTEVVAADALPALAAARVRRALTHLLAVSAGPQALRRGPAEVSRLVLAGPRPAFRTDDESAPNGDGDDPLECWHATLARLLECWTS